MRNNVTLVDFQFAGDGNSPTFSFLGGVLEYRGSNSFGGGSIALYAIDNTGAANIVNVQNGQTTVMTGPGQSYQIRLQPGSYRFQLTGSVGPNARIVAGEANAG